MKKLALCIGINDFPGTGNDLAGCVNDAQDWENVLVKRGFDVKVLTDKQATRSSILQIMTELLTITDKGDSIIITNSTHGTQIPDNNGDEADGFDEAICVISDDQSKIDLITDDELWKLFKLKKPGVQLVWIADSCHSGTVTRAVGEVYSGKRRFLPLWTLIKYLINNPVSGKREASFEGEEWPCLLLAGCQDNEYCYDDYFETRPNGAFTKTAIEALSKLPMQTTYSDWFRAIKRVLPSTRHPQTPNIIGSYLNAQILS